MERATATARATVAEIMQRSPMTVRVDERLDMTEDLMSLGRAIRSRLL
jgi:hypothetical protein